MFLVFALKVHHSRCVVNPCRECSGVQRQKIGIHDGFWRQTLWVPWCMSWCKMLWVHWRLPWTVNVVADDGLRIKRFSLTVGRRREAHRNNPCQGRHGVQPIFIVVFDVSRCLTSSPTSVARVAIGAFAHLCHVELRLQHTYTHNAAVALL